LPDVSELLLLSDFVVELALLSDFVPPPLSDFADSDLDDDLDSEPASLVALLELPSEPDFRCAFFP
jgi:hypothetical protein